MNTKNLAETKIAEKVVLLKEIEDALELWVINPENGARRINIYKNTEYGKLHALCDFSKESKLLIEKEVFTLEADINETV